MHNNVSWIIEYQALMHFAQEYKADSWQCNGNKK